MCQKINSDGSFNAGPAVHTRSMLPIPAISLSTELPELASLTVEESLQILPEASADQEEGTPALPATQEAHASTEAEPSAIPATQEAHASTEEDPSANLATLEAHASTEEEIMPPDTTMSMALETAEALESDANAKEEALHPSNLASSPQAELNKAFSSQGEGEELLTQSILTLRSSNFENIPWSCPWTLVAPISWLPIYTVLPSLRFLK